MGKRLSAGKNLGVTAGSRGRPWLLGELGMEKLLAAVMREEEGAPCSYTFGGRGGRRAMAAALWRPSAMGGREQAGRWS